MSAPLPGQGVPAGPVLGEDARATVSLVLAEHFAGVGNSYRWNLAVDAVAALLAQARDAGERAGAEAEYTAVYEQHCRKVDPDMEGYSTAGLVGLLVSAVEEKARDAGAAEERERIIKTLLAVDGTEWALAGQYAGVEAARIIGGKT